MSLSTLALPYVEELNYAVINFFFFFLLGVWEYIESTRDKVRDLERRVRLVKANVEQMNNIMSGWSQSPLFRRKEDKKDTLLNLEVILCYYMYICVCISLVC